MLKSRLFITLLSTVIATAMFPRESYSASQDECAIWLCLPSGFPSGCSGAKSAWKKRIKKGRSPLPNFVSCAVADESGHKSSGRYEIGQEQWEQCPANTTTVDQYSYTTNGQARFCISSQCIASNPRALTLLKQGFETPNGCAINLAPARTKQNFIKMWIDGDFQGQFFY